MTTKIVDARSQNAKKTATAQGRKDDIIEATERADALWEILDALSVHAEGGGSASRNTLRQLALMAEGVRELLEGVLASDDDATATGEAIQ